MTPALNAQALKNDFPLLSSPEGSKLVYLDSAATAQKPRCVLDAMTAYYETSNANVARGVYRLAEASTNALEAARRRGLLRSGHGLAADVVGAMLEDGGATGGAIP